MPNKNQRKVRWAYKSHFIDLVNFI